MTRMNAAWMGLVCALLGVTLDFVFNGVFKIIWIVVYGPAYVVAVKLLSTYLERTPWAKLTRVAVTSLLGGAIAGHLLLVGHDRQLIYPMTLTSLSPITLHSNEWPQTLKVQSEKLQAELTRHGVKDVPVVMALILDYGCVRSNKVSSIDGVDVKLDKDASWTWRNDPPGSPDPTSGPGTEDQNLPWCRIRFYRPST